MATTNKSNDSAIQRKVSIDQLADVKSFAEAAALMREVHGTDLLRASDELGDGFNLVDKSKLVGVPLLILEWRIMDSEEKMTFGEKWVIVRAMTQNDDKVVFVDGSTGIRDQLISFTSKHGYSGNLLAEDGLRVSEYDYTDPDKPGSKPVPAKTYYIA